MIEVNYSETLSRASEWYKDNVWIPQDKSIPDFRTWLQFHGGELYIDTERAPHGWWVRFAHDGDFTAFLLKFC